MKKSIVVLSLFVCTIQASTEPTKVQTPMPNQTSKVMQLDPVWDHGQQTQIKYGLDLVSANAVYPELVLKNGSGTPIIINYVAFVPILIQIVQKLNQKVDELQNQIDDLQNHH